MLTVRFDMGEDPPVFLGVDPLPKLDDEEMLEALRETLLSGDRKPASRAGAQA
jgi:hypothetical protein